MGDYTITQIGGSIVPGTTDIGNHGDDTVTTIALPFPYALYGTTFTTVNLSSNGNAQFMKRLKKYGVKTKKEEWSEWISDIEGKAARVAASECGQRLSFK